MLTVNERLRDQAILHAIDLVKLANDVVRRAIAALNLVDPALFASIVTKLDELRAASLTAANVNRLLAEARELNASAYATVNRALERDLRELTQYEVGFQTESLRTMAKGVALPALEWERVYAAAKADPLRGRLMADWASTLGGDRWRRITDAIRLGFVEQKTNDDIVRRLRGTKANGYRDGLLQVDRRNAEAIVRTAVGHYANTAREKVYEQASDLVREVVWISTLDNRTTELCQIRDGKRYSADPEHRPIGHRVPWLAGPGAIHWNCRSSSYPVLRSAEELGLDLPVGERAAMNGAVPADVTYGEWLRSQSPEVQNDVLGVQRAELFRAGKSLESFFDAKGAFLSLEELRRKRIGP